MMMMMMMIRLLLLLLSRWIRKSPHGMGRPTSTTTRRSPIAIITTTAKTPFTTRAFTPLPMMTIHLAATSTITAGNCRICILDNVTTSTTPTGGMMKTVTLLLMLTYRSDSGLLTIGCRIGCSWHGVRLSIWLGRSC